MKMASSSSTGPSKPASTGSPRPNSSNDAIMRNALRYTISAREYEALHKYVISRSRVLKRKAPSVESVKRIMNGDVKGKGRATSEGRGFEGAVGADDFNARAVRHSLRVFFTTAAGMKLYKMVMRRLTGQEEWVSIDILPDHTC
jgi:hypothetical protein